MSTRCGTWVIGHTKFNVLSKVGLPECPSPQDKWPDHYPINSNTTNQLCIWNKYLKWSIDLWKYLRFLHHIQYTLAYPLIFNNACEYYSIQYLGATRNIFRYTFSYEKWRKSGKIFMINNNSSCSFPFAQWKLFK